jgi:hypothetical protein
MIYSSVKDPNHFCFDSKSDSDPYKIFSVLDADSTVIYFDANNSSFLLIAYEYII